MVFQHRAVRSNREGSRGCGSVGRASPCQGEGRGFESRHPLANGNPSFSCVARWVGREARQRPAKPYTRVRVPYPPRAIGAGVARFLHTEEVTGSIPVSPTVILVTGLAGYSPAAQAVHADVAQLVEHHLAKVRVAGSSPVIRSQSGIHSIPLGVVGWPRGEAAACKAVYTGSNPVPTSGDWRRGSALPSHGRGHWFDPSIAHQ